MVFRALACKEEGKEPWMKACLDVMDSFFLENKKEEHPFFSETPSNIHYKKPHKAWLTEAQQALLKVKEEYKFNKPTNTFIREVQVRNSNNTVPARVWVAARRGAPPSCSQGKRSP